MPLEFLQQTPEQAFRRLEKDLAIASIDLLKYKRMTPRQLGEAIDRIDQSRAKVIQESTYGKWLQSGKFTNVILLREALGFLKEHKEAKAESETLTPGFSYYRGVKQFGEKLQGSKCCFNESAEPFWMNFVSSVPVEKALMILEHGTEDNFRTIYIELADGRIDALNTVSIEHITESSDEALSLMEAYCDERWNGPWPWETSAPLKLHMMIQDNAMRKSTTIKEMQDRFASLLTKLNEGDMGQFEVVLAAKEMVDKIQGMIEDLGKLQGEGVLTLKDNARSAFGDDTPAQIDAAVTQPLNQAADMLSQLRASMENVVQQLEGGADIGISAAHAGMDTGAPPMGGMDPAADPMGGMDAAAPPEMGVPGEPSPDAIADVDIAGEEVERPKKEI